MTELKKAFMDILIENGIELKVSSCLPDRSLAVGLAWIASRVGCQTSGSIAKWALRYVIGPIGIMILWFGLGQVFSRGETLIPLVLRYVRYSLVGFWITAGAPWLFFHFKLVSPQIWDARLL